MHNNAIATVDPLWKRVAGDGLSGRGGGQVRS